MRTGIRILGLDAPHTGPLRANRLPLVWAIAGLASLVPLAASTAASPDAATPTEAVASSAAIELVPLQPDTEVTAPALPDAAPAPSAPQETVMGRGSASYYAAKFDGRRTASGERFDNGAMTAAHRTLPFGTLVRVTNVANGRSVIVRINDRGPFSRGRMIDVSRAAASELGLVARGHGTVELAVIAD
ncbi:septal ring lytic transglycosylase RlpA family protein [Erythrobacter sp. CCH5-A1]|jgi:rare lipoprotein A|uniref:septal ring lytic transglycosylase RlpA family protein n=1 Tax=Erythrobacter sp. CCH5-A1 TaxID=1768792 RepID=UPI0009E7381C|nr:septal ring lytic transglycosylase RlpA family protein [Erythrobacter sp. CCH5-A1]